VLLFKKSREQQAKHEFLAGATHQTPPLVLHCAVSVCAQGQHMLELKKI
jgi:hypothetical protein